MNTGVLARCALISSLYKRGMRLTPKARSIHSNAGLINHMSTDVSLRSLLSLRSLTSFLSRSFRLAGSVSQFCIRPLGTFLTLLSLDYAAQWFHAVWTAPIQVMVCLALLLVQVGQCP